MGFATRVIVMAGLAFGLAADMPAGPPSGGGHSSGGPISGPAPLGASGPAPVHASGSLIGNPYSGSGYRNGGNRGGYAPGGYTHGGITSSRPGHGDLHDGDRHRGDRRDYRHSPAAFFFAPYYYPSLDYESPPYDSGYEGPDVGQDPAIENMVQSQGQLGQQVRRLTSEIEELKQQQNQPSPYVMSSPAAPEDAQPNTVPITLILRSGQSFKVHDYAVVNGVFWDFTTQPARKIRLSDIDIEASVKATQAQGGEFPEVSNNAQPGN